jgi:hypothetical protein
MHPKDLCVGVPFLERALAIIAIRQFQRGRDESGFELEFCRSMRENTKFATLGGSGKWDARCSGVVDRSNAAIYRMTAGAANL